MVTPGLRWKQSFYVAVATRGLCCPSGLRPMFISSLPPIPQSRAGLRSALFVTQVLPLPIKPMEWVTPSPVREAITYPLTNGTGEADIYRIPDGKRRAGVLVFLGVNPAPRDDRRAVNLGNGLARSGFVAMFPWSPSLQEKRINPSEPENLVWAFRHLKGLDYVDPHRVGIGGFCVGASIALVAASDPRINEDVDFVSSFGAYYSMWDVVKQVSTESSFYNEQVEPWEPSPDTVEVFTNQLIEGLDDEKERDILARIFIQKDASEIPANAKLSTAGAALYRLLFSLTAKEGEQRLSLGEAHQLKEQLICS